MRVDGLVSLVSTFLYGTADHLAIDPERNKGGLFYLVPGAGRQRQPLNAIIVVFKQLAFGRKSSQQQKKNEQFSHAVISGRIGKRRWGMRFVRYKLGQ